MKFEAITVCVGYADFLEHTAKANHKLFDKWIIITTFKDTETQAICKQYNLTCVLTDKFYENEARFDKFAGINEGLKHTSDDAFIIFLDGDIVLHELHRHALNNLELRTDTLYGCDRLNCKGWKEYKRFNEQGRNIHENWLMHAAGLEFGARINQYYGQEGEDGRFRGWLPLGFFQIAHRSSFGTYPPGLGKADHGDIEFAMKYSRHKRVLIPEILGIHLMSMGTFKGHNWQGRYSLPFTEENG